MFFKEKSAEGKQKPKGQIYPMIYSLENTVVWMAVFLDCRM